MKFKKKTMLFVLAAIMIMLLAACGGGNNPPADAGGDGVTDGEPKEKVFYMSRGWEDTSWDPVTFTGNDQLALTPHIFETLCKLNEDGSSGPLLAESWEVSPDGLIVTFYLRQGVQWHKGYGEFTSEDVKFTFERHSDPAVGSIHGDNLNLSNLVSIETPDKYTVVFNLAEPDADFLTRCSQYSSIITSKAAFADLGMEGFAIAPVGTGPFQFESGTPGQRTEAVKFEEFWGGAPKIDRIVHNIISDENTNYAAFENKELDFIYVYYRDKVNEFVSKGYPETYRASRELLYVGNNMQLAPFDDPLVRQAFYSAIDPQYYADELFYGQEQYTGGWIPPRCKYSLSDFMQPDYNPEKAKQLLAEAGYPNGVDVTMWSVNDDISPAPALITQSQLSKAGFNVELQLVDFGVFIEKVRAGEAQLWMLYNTTPPLADDTLTRYRTDAYPGSNWCGVQNAEYDAIVQRGVEAKTEAEKQAAFEEAQRLFATFNVLYPVSTYGYHYITQPYVTGLEMWGDLALRLRNADILDH